MRLRVLLLALVLLLGLVSLTACGGDDDEAGGEPAVTETETESEPSGEGDPEAGAQVFAQAGCGGCHVLAAANSSGSVGPNLDDTDPDFDLVVERVTNGQGVMPSFKDQLSEQQINDVAAYVSESAGG